MYGSSISFEVEAGSEKSKCWASEATFQIPRKLFIIDQLVMGSRDVNSRWDQGVVSYVSGIGINVVFSVMWPKNKKWTLIAFYLCSLVFRIIFQKQKSSQWKRIICTLPLISAGVQKLQQELKQVTPLPEISPSKLLMNQVGTTKSVIPFKYRIWRYKDIKGHKVTWPVLDVT